MKHPDPYAIGAVSESDFSVQMKALARCFEVISLPEVARRHERKERHRPAVCITFDDGYRDNHDVAMPILKKHGFEATLFLATQFIGTDEKVWYDKVMDIFKNATASRWKGFPDRPADVSLEDDHSRVSAGHALLPWLKKFRPEVRDARIQEMEAYLKPQAKGKVDRLMLTWEEVGTLRRNGFHIGAHTKTHPILSTLTQFEIRSEIESSRNAISERLGFMPDLFAYPNGRREDYNLDCISCLEELGFIGAVTTNSGVHTYADSRFEMKRRQAWEQSGSAFAGRLALEFLTTRHFVK